MVRTLGAFMRLVALVSCSVAVPLEGQARDERVGLWVQLGIGWGSRNCESCGGRVNGASGMAAIGGTLAPAFRLGLATNAWMGHVEEETTYGSSSGTEGLFVAAPVVRYHVGDAQKFSLIAGAGLGLGVGTSGGGEFGSAVLLGANLDLPGSPRVAPALIGQGTLARISGSTVTLFQFGIGLNVY